MKKIGYLTFAALLAFGSCTNEINEECFVDKANTISFNAYSNKTRAYSGGDVADISVMKEGSFGVVGYTSDNNLYLGSTDKAIGQRWNSTSNSWEYATPSDLKYWPANSMDFYAYFPYSAQGDVFAQSDASGDVMTITNESGDQDILFARAADISQTNYVPLYFKHALSKLKAVYIKVNAVDVQVEVQKITFLNTSTKGKIKVNYSGEASYETTSSDVPRSFDFTSATKTITYNANPSTTYEGVELFGNDDNGYIFATNTNDQHNVKGTGKSLWSAGDKTSLGSSTLPNSNLVCMELDCKVIAAGHYLVGSADAYGKMYIPMHGTSSNNADISELLAGRRYTYKVVMESNVGYDKNGDPIMLAPIRFSVNEVPEWSDVTVTINL
ncbi:MAG: fimbrillin family protein [Prevotella sp.]|nr:fimbrillin family protein [Prevotella sp.]